MDAQRGPFPDAPRLSRRRGGLLGVLILVGFLCFLVGLVLLLVGTAAKLQAATTIGALLLVLSVVSILAVRRPLRRVRDQRVPYLAGKFGMSFSPSDPFGLVKVGLPFEVFRQRGVEIRNVMWGRVQGQEVKGFDLRFQTYGGSEEGWQYTDWQFAGLGEANANCPRLSLVRGPLASNREQPRVTFESGEFNREFTVLCADERFAFAVLDQRLLEWLLASVPPSVEFEFSGPFVLAGKRNGHEQGTEVIHVLSSLGGLLTRFPPVVSSLYPPQ
jgi:hypothetical protein